MNFAELNRDFGTLLSYNHFKQQVMDMNTIYGHGGRLWKVFSKTCAIATDSYEPETSDIDKNVMRIAKGFAVKNIAFNPMPAIKQLLSLPAFFGEVSPEFIAQDLSTFGIPAVKWAWENMPNFRKRVKSRTMGDYYLSNSFVDEEKGWIDKLQEEMKKGMYPNIGVDAWTVAVGAHGVYKTALRRYKRQGFAEDVAERRAIQDAELCFNKSQQSSEGPYMAPIQIDHTAFGATAMLYRNSSTSYSREYVASVRNLKHMANGEVSVDFMAKQLLRQLEIPTFGKRFDEELSAQIAGILPADHIYALGKPGGVLLSAGFPDKPIELSASHLAGKSMQAEHPFPIDALKGLVGALNRPIAVFRYGPSAMNVIVGLEHAGKRFLVGVHFNQNRGGSEVSSIRGLFPKDTAEWLNWISQGKATYLDVNRVNKSIKEIQALIKQQHINYADVPYLDLDAVAKVTESFVNPAVPSGKSFSEYRDEDVARVRDEARRMYRSGFLRNVVNMVMFGHVLPYFWRIGGLAFLLMLSGDDDEKKNALVDVNRHALLSPLEGFTYGDVMNDLAVTGYGKAIGEESARWANVGRTHPALSDLSLMMRHMDSDFLQGCNDAVNFVVGGVTGANPQMVANLAAAFIDKCGDDKALAAEWSIFCARLFNAPQSQLDKMYFDEVGLRGDEASKLTPDELAERFARYKVTRGYFLTRWFMDDEDALKKHKARGMSLIKERLGGLSGEEVNEAYDAYAKRSKEFGERVKAAEDMAKKDYVKAAAMYQVLKKDVEGQRIYKMFQGGKGQRGLNSYFEELVDLYMNARNVEEAGLLRDAVLDYKASMVRIIGATDERKAGEEWAALQSKMGVYEKAYGKAHAGFVEEQRRAKKFVEESGMLEW